MGYGYETVKTLALKWLPHWALNRLKKIHYVSKVRNTSVTDEPDLGAVEYLIRSGDRVVDIGANIGVYTAFLANGVGKEGRVYSFEPIPSTFEFLLHNIGKLRLANVVAKRLAITEHVCRLQMSIPREENGSENYYQAAVVESNAAARLERVELIEGMPLDMALGDDAGNIAFVKCDVEGHELQCLHGARGVLSRSKPSWLIEISGDPGRPGSNAAAVTFLMREHGYGMWTYANGMLVPWESGRRSVNYLFLTPSQLEVARARGLRVA